MFNKLRDEMRQENILYQKARSITPISPRLMSFYQLTADPIIGPLMLLVPNPIMPFLWVIMAWECWQDDKKMKKAMELLKDNTTGV